MKKGILCALCLLLLASCGRQTDGTVVSTTAAGEVIEEGLSMIVLPDEIETETGTTAEEVTCELLEKDGKVYGFEMRFRRTNALEALLSTTDNFCFGVLQCGKKRIAVPTEEIRLLVDVPTDCYVATLLVPQGEKLSGSSATVSFHISAHADGVSKTLFTAQQTVDIS